MVVRSLLVLALLLLVFVQKNEALSCVPCEKEKICDKIVTCKFGLAKDMCGCCDICAKGPGETCGGVWNHGGTCGKGLNCHPNPDPARDQDPGRCSPKPLPPGYKPKYF
ncbi:hypothetical protein CHUAL_009934 [Chamberlinius hualienensis]